MLKVINQQLYSGSNLVTTGTSDALNVENVDGFSVQAVWDVNTPSAITFVDGDVDVNANSITEASHGFTTGLKGQLTNSGGALPAGLSAATDYFVIAVDANTFKLASSLVNAQAGTAVDITAAAGGGTHTFTPTSIAGGVVKLQATHDDASDSAGAAAANWTDLSNSQNMTADSNYIFKEADSRYRFIRVHATLTAGRVSVTARIIGHQNL